MRFIPKTRMGIFTALLVLIWLVKTIFVTAAGRQWLSPGLSLLLGLTTLLLAIPAVYYTLRLFGLMRRRLLWKIRRRLILAHVFIGAIPVLLVLLIVYVTGLLFYYQLNYYLLTNQIGIHIAQIHAYNLSLRASLHEALSSSSSPSTGARLQSTLDRDGKYILGAYPSAAIVMRVQQGNGEIVSGNRNVVENQLRHYLVPRWTLEREFNGLVVEDWQPQVYRSADVQPEDGGRGRLFLRSLVSSDFRPEMPFTVEISVPFDRYLLDRLKAAIGQDMLLADNVPVSGLNVMLQNTDLIRSNVLSATFDVESRQSRSVWSILLFPTSWNSGTEVGGGDSQILFVELSTSKLVDNVFRTENNVSRTILGVLQIVVGFFLLVEAVSVVMGILLTKSITNAVHNLDRGTAFIKRGDFSHRVVVRSDDQLGALATSFNQMTEYVQALVKERVQKERLERELEIAKEVQEQLFPRGAPLLERMELAGTCLPARVVSGDYYDFLKFGPGTIGLALGDICGKGISAALLMANLQATLRSNVSQLFNGADLSGNGGDASVARVVKILNDQIYAFTSANKFASLFYGIYDDRHSSLTYCNAGHNPPLFFNASGCARLSTGGTVVGIFPDADFEQETVALASGDILLAYTDGISESVNEYGEEFGEERIIATVEKHRGYSAADLQKVIMETVLIWAYEEERDDDMTLIVGKVR